MKLKTKLSTLLLGITSIFALTAAIVTNPNSGSAIEAKAEDKTETYQHIFTTKPGIGDNDLSGVSWTISATTLNAYNKGYAGVQFGSSKANGQITLTSSSEWNYKGYTQISEVRLWLNLGGTSVTPTVTIGGVAATSDETTVVKNTTANVYTNATKVTFTPETTNTGVVVIDVTSAKAGYICAIEIDATGSTTASATLQSITAESTQTKVYQNEELDTSAITVTGHYDDGSEDGLDKVISSGWTVECDTSVVATGVIATVTYKELTDTFTDTFTVDVVESEKYSLVTDITQLVEGSKIIIAGEKSGTLYAATNYASGNNFPAKIATIQDGKIVKTSDIAAMTIGTCSNGYTIQDENDLYLYAASSSKNYLKGQAEANENAYWSITYSNNEFSVVAHKSKNTHNILRYNSSDNLFSCYESGQKPVKLYVLNPEPTNASKLETFGRLYLNSYENPLVTSETGIAGTSCSKLYLAAKKALSGAWSCIKTDLQNDTTGLALRYEAWARANGDQTPYDGNEAIVNMLNLRATLTNSQSTESSIALVVVIAVISLSSICCYFALNRKKEQK